MGHHTARALLAIGAALAIGTYAAPSAQALAPGQLFGVADQNTGAAMFQDARLTRLQPAVTRYIADYDVAQTPSTTRNQLDSWYDGARQHNQRMVIAFGSFVRSAPSDNQYRAGLEAFRARYPLVREWEPMNEANHETQPTRSRPALAARYVLIARDVCPKCTIVQLSLVLGFDDPVSYTRQVLARLPSSERTRLIFGLHTYSDTNRGTSAGLTRFLRKFRKGTVWITEAGAVARYSPRWPHDLARQSAATALVFRQAIAAKRRVKRLYWYEWDGPSDPSSVWDSGLLDSAGRTRPAYRIAVRERFRTRLTRAESRRSGLAELARASQGR